MRFSVFIKFVYDAVGNRTQVIDGIGSVTKFAYDGLNRLVQTLYDYGQPAQSQVLEVYNTLNKIQRTDGTGRVTNYFYDPLNRITDVVYPASFRDNLHYSRDAVGNVLGVTHPHDTGLRDVVYAYDKLNRHLTETSAESMQTLTYDAAGNRLGLRLDDPGSVLSYGYDALNRLAVLTDAAGVTGYAYDLSGNVVTKGHTEGGTLVHREARVNDQRNRVTTLQNQDAVGTDLAGFAYQYDLAGNVLQIVETVTGGGLAARTILNSYDGIYRLTQEKISPAGSATVITDYYYDKNHNRTSQYVSNVGETEYDIGDGANGAGTNQIISTIGPDGTTVFYWYDANGNRIYQSNVGRFPVRGGSSSSGGVGAGTYYEYDNENRLIGIQGPAGSFAYAYDYRTRRVQRGEPGGTTCIVFDGGVSSFEYLTLPMAPSVRYVRGHNYGGGVGGLEYTVRGSTARINCYNSRGDVVAQRIGGAFSYQAAYEAFGLHPGDHGSTPDRQKASTKEEDPTGLLNEGFRYRDPNTGTFLSRDPLGFKAGPNMYTYVRQNPWTNFDPEGLDVQNANISHKPPGQVCIECHGVSAGGYSGNIHGFAGLATLPGSGPHAAAGYNVLKNASITAVASSVPMGEAIGPVVAGAGKLAAKIPGVQAAVTKVADFANSLKSTAPTATARGTAETNTTVGRWMSPAEYNKTVSTSTVQESRSGTTHVTSPADSSVFKPTAPPGSVHAQFDVPATSVKPTSASGVAKITGPNSLEGRLAASKGQPVPQMPPASNIKITDNKPPVKPVQPQQQSH